MIVVLAKNVVKAECRDAFIAKVKENYPNVLAEKGCISYVLAHNADTDLSKQIALDENTLIFVECWESLEALKAHLASPHMAAFRDAVMEMRESSELRIVTPV